MNDLPNIKAMGLTHVGRVRSSNQDAYLCLPEEGLFIVADGMGGHAGGEIASQLCVETIKSYVQDNTVFRNDTSFSESRLHLELAKSINAASAKIYERALEEPNLRGMGTTATVALVRNDNIYYAHVGDSRFYLIRRGFIYQITHDHSLVSEQVRAGILTREEADLHHLRNVITRSVGYQEEEDVDSGVLTAEPRDLLLLCSDGLHGKLKNKELSQIIQNLKAESVHELVDLANQRGGDDNISVVVFAI
jgi:serine/threonine protein phosphatase PrpC